MSKGRIWSEYRCGKRMRDYFVPRARHALTSLSPVLWCEYMSISPSSSTCTHAILDPRYPVRVCSMSDGEFIDRIANDPHPPGAWLGHMLLEHTDQLAAFLHKLPPLP